MRTCAAIKQHLKSIGAEEIREYWTSLNKPTQISQPMQQIHCKPSAGFSLP
jgi:hypothetical protein